MPSSKGRTPGPKLPLLECSGRGCERRVRQTRPSKSGLHFCDSPECQREKGRLAYQARARRAAGLVAQQEQFAQLNVVQLLGDAANAERTACPACGLTNALPHWPHRSKVGAPCYALSGTSRDGITPAHIDAVWPEPREYADV